MNGEAAPTPEPKLVTAAYAAFLVGVPKAQIATWVQRGELWSLGIAADSHSHLYSLKRCRELAVSYHARKAAKAAKEQARAARAQ